jgi:hypothetical protein
MQDYQYFENFQKGISKLDETLKKLMEINILGNLYKPEVKK